MTEIQESFLNFAQEKITFIKEQTNLINHGEISIPDLNRCLAEFSSTSAYLIFEYEQASLEEEMLKDEYKLDYSSWYQEARNHLNATRVSSKFANGTEIEADALIAHKELYLAWRKRLLLAEKKSSMYRRYLDLLKTQGNLLVQISQNARQEGYSLHVENAANRERLIRKVPKKHD
jgi:hypothetical protein